MSIELVGHSTISFSVAPFFSCLQFCPSIRVFSNESALCIRWPKYWNFSFSVSPSNECSGLISFRIDSFDLLAVQGTLKVFSSTTVQKHQFFGTQPSLRSILTSLPDYWINHNFDYVDLHTSVYFGEAGLPALSMFWAEQLYIIKECVPICEII